MLKKILFLGLLLLVPLFAQYGIEVDRTIESTVLAGETVDITLEVTIEDLDLISSIIVTETIPEGWEVVSSDPQADEFEEKIKWLIFGSSLEEEMTLEYTLQAPEDFSGEQELSGYWDIVGSGHGVIGGDSFITETPPEEPESGEEVAEDYTLYYVIGALVVIIVALLVFKKKKK